MSLSSFWGGRLRATRLSFFYIAGLALWFGMKSYGVNLNNTHTEPSVHPIVSQKKCVKSDFQYNPKTHTPQPRNTDKPETCKEEKSID